MSLEEISFWVGEAVKYHNSIASTIEEESST